jgi:transmembrane sensor
MERDSKYKFYTVEDFVEDNDFRSWVNFPSEILHSFWSNYIRKFPEKAQVVEEARQIVRALLIEEDSICREDYNDSINELKAYIDKKSLQKNKIRKLSFLLRNVAALLLLPLLALSLYLLTNKNQNDRSGQFTQYITPIGQKSKVILADGTQVWLNSGSKLTVSMNDSHSRRVQLSGEAFFDVTENKKSPFLVETKNYTVKVYGTQFNIRAFDDKIESEAILKVGSISVLTSKEEIKIEPGQRYYIDNNGKSTISEVNPELYITWKDNLLKINKEKLADLIVRIEHWYGVKIKIKDYDRFKDLKYTLTIKTESLREMLDLMNYVTPLTYEIEGESITLTYKLN